MTGSSARLARGASHQKRTASAQRGPTVVLSRSIGALIAGESGVAGAGGAPPRWASIAIGASTTAIAAAAICRQTFEDVMALDEARSPVEARLRGAPHPSR